MGYCYKTETLELSLLEDGIYLMNLDESTDPDTAFPTKVKTVKTGMLVMPIHFRGAYNRAHYASRTQLVTIFTAIEDLSESERIDLEWALMNQAS